MSVLYLVSGWRLPVLCVLLALVGLGFLVRPKQTKWVLMFLWLFLVWFQYAYMTRFFCAYDPQFFFHDNCIYMLGLKFKALPGSQPHVQKQRRSIIMGSHRNMMDAMIYDRLVSSRAAILGRMFVAYAFPHYWIWSKFNHAIWFFNRGGRGDNLEPFFKWIDFKFTQTESMRNSLYVAVEGHRNRKSTPLPLKKGMVKYAWSRKTLAQPLIYFGHELAMDEDTLSCTPGQTCYYFIDEPLEPKDGETQHEWHARCEERFIKVYKETYEKYQAAIKSEGKTD